MPLVVSASALIGFVAFAGSVIVWTRLNAVEVPPDQAITAFPRGELVAIGSALLLLFGFFGVLAVIGAFLIDRGGRPTQGMAFGLLLLVLVEGATAILIASASLSAQTWAALLLFALPLGIALWMLRLDIFTELTNKLHSRPGEKLEPELRHGLLRPAPEGGGASPATAGRSSAPVWLPIGFGGLGVLAAVTMLALGAKDTAVLWVVGSLAFLFVIAVLGGLWIDSTMADGEEGDGSGEEEEEEEAAAGHRWHTLKEDAASARLWLSDPAGWLEWRRQEAKARREARAEREKDREEERLRRKRPHRLSLKGFGYLLVPLALLVAAVLPAWQLEKQWLAWALLAAAVIAMWLWRMAIFTRDKVVWFGIAVFLSVPLFGTLMTMVRNLEDPQIQPVALIRSTDGPDEAIQGLYVTEGEDRVYFATVATQGCGGELRPNSGRLLWVPKDEVVAMSIGPLQSVDEAARTSLEMSYALTPAVETPAGDRVSLTAEEARSEEGGLGEEPLRVQRLENVGPAVRPVFGRGLHMSPENAPPGEEVTLWMSAPDAEVEGFGKAREGRTLRVGGVPAPIVKNPVADAERAEFVKTDEGKPLALDKRGVYVVDRENGRFELVPLSERPELKGGKRFVKLADKRGVEGVSPGPLGEEGYLEIEDASRVDGTRDRVAGEQEVRLGPGQESVEVAPSLLRQAWNRDRIVFRVPKNAETGIVSVECEQLAGQPLLRLERPPEARIRARMQPGSGGIALDSRLSRDDGEVVARRWKVAGLPRGHGPTLKLRLPPRLALRTVHLTVRDDDGETDTAVLRVLRFPPPFFVPGEAVPHSPALVGRAGRAVLAGGPAELHFHGHADAVGRAAARISRSYGRAENVRDALLDGEGADTQAREDDLRDLKVTVRGYGDACPLAGLGGAVGHRRVDVFALGEGVTIVPRRLGCSPRRAMRLDLSADGGS